MFVNLQLFALGLAVMGAAAYVIHLALSSATRLGIGYFRPYRGEGWPPGVQEDDDVRFDWGPHPVRRETIAPGAEPPAASGPAGSGGSGSGRRPASGSAAGASGAWVDLGEQAVLEDEAAGIPIGRVGRRATRPIVH